jgi:predicted neuraminidase
LAEAPPSDEGGRTAFWGVPRAPMSVAISEDGGRTWPHRRDLEVGDGYCMTNNSREKVNREYSYPSIKQGPDGALHIAFTYFRQAIKYVRIDEAWVRQ